MNKFLKIFLVYVVVTLVVGFSLQAGLKYDWWGIIFGPYLLLGLGWVRGQVGIYISLLFVPFLSIFYIKRNVVTVIVSSLALVGWCYFGYSLVVGFST